MAAYAPAAPPALPDNGAARWRRAEWLALLGEKGITALLLAATLWWLATAVIEPAMRRHFDFLDQSLAQQRALTDTLREMNRVQEARHQELLAALKARRSP